jgi:hypothetical protein
MKHKNHKVDFCVVGGGLAGMCAAIAAARRGIKVALIQDRPVFGGNASSEIRMWICGVCGRDNRETGIIEELQLENRYRNPRSNYSIWDSVLYEKVRFEPNITMLLNCSANDIEMDGSRIKAVKAWQLTTETWHRVEAELFSDCSGDSILAPLTGAEFRIGREAREEFGEDAAPEVSDDKTMGLSCLLQTRETNSPQTFVPPQWAYKYINCGAFPHREHTINEIQNFWWLEIGGQRDTVHDTEEIRDELLKIAYGVWDHIKNHCDNKDRARNWVIDWVGVLPGKRESRRYIGDYVLRQSDLVEGREFDDVVAFGGWPMDDHHPAGFDSADKPTRFIPVPSPFGIPYRCLYSRNIENLFFAGRNISVTHTAMSSTRVMATCAALGQAVGIAAAIAVRDGLSPRDLHEKGTNELQGMLQDDDCFLLGRPREIPELSRKARLTASLGDPEPLRNRIDRSLNGEDNGWYAGPDQWVEYRFEKPEKIMLARLIFDSDLNRLIRKKKLGRDIVANGNDPAAASAREMRCCYPLHMEPMTVPECMTRAFRIEAEDENGKWTEIFRQDNNYQRLVRVPLNVKTSAVRLVCEKTWGAEKAHVFAWDVR